MEAVKIFIPAGKRLYNWALGLSLFTIFYNIAEGVVSTFLGYGEGSSSRL